CGIEIIRNSEFIYDFCAISNLLVPFFPNFDLTNDHRDAARRCAMLCDGRAASRWYIIHRKPENSDVGCDARATGNLLVPFSQSLDHGIKSYSSLKLSINLPECVARRMWNRNYSKQ